MKQFRRRNKSKPSSSSSLQTQENYHYSPPRGCLLDLATITSRQYEINHSFETLLHPLSEIHHLQDDAIVSIGEGNYSSSTSPMKTTPPRSTNNSFKSPTSIAAATSFFSSSFETITPKKGNNRDDVGTLNKQKRQSFRPSRGRSTKSIISPVHNIDTISSPLCLSTSSMNVTILPPRDENLSSDLNDWGWRGHKGGFLIRDNKGEREKKEYLELEKMSWVTDDEGLDRNDGSDGEEEFATSFPDDPFYTFLQSDPRHDEKNEENSNDDDVEKDEEEGTQQKEDLSTFLQSDHKTDNENEESHNNDDHVEKREEKGTQQKEVYKETDTNTGNPSHKASTNTVKIDYDNPNDNDQSEITPSPHEPPN